MLFVATPVYEPKVSCQYFHGLMQAAHVLGDRGLPLSYSFEQGCQIALNRERLVRRFLSTDCQFLLFIDSDMAFTALDIVSLLAADVDIVSGLYRYRFELPGKIPHCFRTPEGKPIDTKAEGLQECGFVPTGMLLIRRRVIELLYSKHPYLFDQGFRDTAWFQRLFPDMPEDSISAEFEGEDVHFSKLWRDMGGKFFVDAAVKVGHIGTREFRVE